MSDLTITQRLLRPVLNYLVERFFPGGAFYGNDYFKAIDDANLAEKWGTSEMGCAAFIISFVRENGGDKGVFSVEDMTDKGVLVGSWSLTVERTDAPTEGEE